MESKNIPSKDLTWDFQKELILLTFPIDRSNALKVAISVTI